MIQIVITISESYLDRLETLAESLHVQRGQNSRASVDETLKQQVLARIGQRLPGGEA